MSAPLPPLPPGTGSRPYRNQTLEKLRRDIDDQLVAIVDTLVSTGQLETITRALGVAVAGLKSTADTVTAAMSSAEAVHTSLQTQATANAQAIASLNLLMTNQAQAIAALQAQQLKVPVIRTGSLAMTATLALGGTRDYVVSLDQPFPDANYSAAPLPIAGLVGAGTATVKSQTASNVTVTVKTNVLLGLGTVVGVQAVRLT